MISNSGIEYSEKIGQKDLDNYETGRLMQNRYLSLKYNINNISYNKQRPLN